MIQFKEMAINGFASIQDLKFNWAGDHGVVILSARNGSGKSRLINALYWVLFGKSLYGSVNTWDHIKPVGYNGTKVELELEIDNVPYKIVRCMGWLGKIGGHAGKNRFIVYENGKEWDIKDKKDIQGAWLKILKYTPNLFLNSILFGQKQKRMLDNKSSEKKELFDEAFDVTILNKAYAIASNETKEILQDIANLERERQGTSSKLKMLQEEDRRQEEKEKEFYEDIQKQISRHKEEIERLHGSEEKTLQGEIKAKEDELASIEKSIKTHYKKIEEIGLKGFENKNGDLIDKLANIKSEISYTNKAIEKKESELAHLRKNTVCPTCGKPYDRKEIEKAAESINIEIKDLYEELKSHVFAKGDIDGKIAVLKDKQKRTEDIQNRINLCKRKKAALESEISGYKRALFRLENSIELIKEKNAIIENLKTRKFKKVDYQSKIENYTKTLKAQDKGLLKLRVSKKRLQFSQHLFSNKGIKSWLFSYLLDSVNRKLMDYASVSGFEINFWVDLESPKGDIYSLVKLWGEEVPYEDLSGGQQQLVNLLTIFAVMDVIQEKRPCPLFIGDELFESLDSDNIRIVSNLVQQKAQEKKMVIVTHLGDFIIENAQVIKLENHNGITVLS